MVQTIGLIVFLMGTGNSLLPYYLLSDMFPERNQDSSIQIIVLCHNEQYHLTYKFHNFK